MAGKQPKKPRITLWTPPGMFSFPYFVAPDTGREYSDGKYKTDLAIPKPIFKEKGKELQEAVLSVGKEYFGNKYDLKKGKHPFRDTDKDDKILIERMKNCILIKPKGGIDRQTKKPIRPMFIGPRRDANKKFIYLTEEEISEIVGGWWGALNVTVFPYDQSGGGVTLGLNAVQLWKEDEPFGQGRAKVLESAEELEVDVDEPNEDDLPDDSSESEDGDDVFA